MYTHVLERALQLIFFTRFLAYYDDSKIDRWMSFFFGLVYYDLIFNYYGLFLAIKKNEIFYVKHFEMIIDSDTVNVLKFTDC